MAAKLLVSIFVCVCAVSVCHGWFWKQPKCWAWSPTEAKRCVPCELTTRNVTLVVRNVLRPNNFEETVSLPCTRFKTLFDMMVEAAETNAAFKFSASYSHAGHPGFFVTSFNGLYSQWEVDQTWWQILDGDLKLTPVGVSTYEPRDGETVTFNFTQGFGH